MRRPLIAAVIAIAGMLFAAPAAEAVQVSPNPWLTKRFLNIAHQGGEDEAPSSTMYALKSAITEGGADMLEIDVQLTRDGELVVLHDDVWNTKSCLPALCPSQAMEPTRPTTQIRNTDLHDLQALDAAYWFRPNTYEPDYTLPDSAYPFRGIRTGEVPPPAGYTANDFRIPTLEEVLDTFPTTPINIEIKMPKSNPTPRPFRPSCVGPPQTEVCDDLDLTIPTTDALIALLNQAPYASRQDLIVVSFAQEAMEMFAAGAPQIHRAPSEEAVLDFVAGSPLDPDGVVFQVPPQQGPFAVPELLIQQGMVQQQGYGVHVFTDGDSDETPARYARFINVGVEGIMTSRPRALHNYLCAAGVRRPDGSARCPAQDQQAAPVTTPTPPAAKKCKKGKKGKKGKKLKKGKCVKKKKAKKKGKA